MCIAPPGKCLNRKFALDTSNLACVSNWVNHYTDPVLHAAKIGSMHILPYNRVHTSASEIAGESSSTPPQVNASTRDAFLPVSKVITIDHSMAQMACKPLTSSSVLENNRWGLCYTSSHS